MVAPGLVVRETIPLRAPVPAFLTASLNTGGGFDYSYNAQAAVDDTAHIIVAAELGNNAADSGQLPTVLAAVLRDAGADPRQVLADAGYRSASDV